MIAEVLSREFEALKKEVIEAYNAKGMKASGQFEKSLEVIVTEERAVLMGEDYTQQLDTGRRPGPVSKEGFAKIKQWILDKGVFTQALAEISLSSLAFLIARKIAREGFDRAKFGGVDLISDIITEQRIQKIIDEVGYRMAIEYSTQLVKVIKELK